MKNKENKHRSFEAMKAILHNKASMFHDRREERGGSKNIQAELLEEYNMSLEEKVKLLVYVDLKENVEISGQKVCAHCSYFSYDKVRSEGSCYEPKQLYVGDTMPTKSCPSWKMRADAMNITNYDMLPSKAEVVPAKFMFIEDDDADDE